MVGFDNEQHVYGEARYPAQLVIQDVLTIHGAQFKDAALIVASPPCQAYSYRAMPWKRAKALPPPDNSLFEACFRIQREASEAAGRRIPLVVENVCGAQKWVGRARWHYGSFYLWGDVPALMPIVRKHVKVPTMGAGWYPPDHPKHVSGLAFNGHADRNLRATKNDGGSWFNIGSPEQKVTGQNPDGRKTVGHVNKRDGHNHTRHLTNQAEHVKGLGLGRCVVAKERGLPSERSSQLLLQVIGAQSRLRAHREDSSSSRAPYRKCVVSRKAGSMTEDAPQAGGI